MPVLISDYNMNTEPYPIGPMAVCKHLLWSGLKISTSYFFIINDRESAHWVVKLGILSDIISS